jgi:tetratricopeptide (TPR) repeat protein
LAWCLRPRATSRARGCATNVRWRSTRRHLARSISVRRRLSIISPACFKPRAMWQARGPLRTRAGDPREAHGPEHPNTAYTLDSLAHLLLAQGDLTAARPLVERALAIKEKVLGPENPNTAQSLNNLASLLEKQSDLVGALPLHERAPAIRERVLGPEHPDTATSLDHLARLFQAQGDLAGARPYYERALAIREKVLGQEHPDTNRVRAAVLRARGRRVERQCSS